MKTKKPRRLYLVVEGRSVRYERIPTSLSRYGLTADKFFAMLKAQGGECAICRHKPSRRGRREEWTQLVIDHCHKTGKVRALLCQRCNCLLGFAKDDINCLVSAIAYLEKYSPEDEHPCPRGVV